MPFKVLNADGVLWLRDGRRWSKNMIIGNHELPKPVLAQLLKEKAIEILPGVPGPSANDDNGASQLTPDLTVIEGLSQDHMKALHRRGVKTFEAVANATDEELTQLWGVGDTTARKIRQQARRLQ